MRRTCPPKLLTQLTGLQEKTLLKLILLGLSLCPSREVSACLCSGSPMPAGSGLDIQRCSAACLSFSSLNPRQKQCPALLCLTVVSDGFASWRGSAVCLLAGSVYKERGNSAHGNPECWLLFHPKLNHFRQSFSRLDSVVLESVHSVWAKSESPLSDLGSAGGSLAGRLGECRKSDGQYL